MTETFTGVSGALQAGMDSLYSLSQQFPEISAWYTPVIRFVLPVFGLLILLTALRPLFFTSPDDSCIIPQHACREGDSAPPKPAGSGKAFLPRFPPAAC